MMGAVRAVSESSYPDDEAEGEYKRVFTDGLLDELFATVNVMYSNIFASGFGKCATPEVSSQVALSASDDASEVDIVVPSVAIALKATEAS